MSTDELFGAYNFLIEVAGVTADQNIIVGGFKSMSGMDSHTEVVDFAQGNDAVVRKKPGRSTYSNIVLERGFTATDDLWQWRKNIEEGRIDRRSGTITVLDQDGASVVAQYTFYEGWPCKWYVPALNSDAVGGTPGKGGKGGKKASVAMAIEKIEIAVEKVERTLA